MTTAAAFKNYTITAMSDHIEGTGVMNADAEYHPGFSHCNFRYAVAPHEGPGAGMGTGRRRR